MPSDNQELRRMSAEVEAAINAEAVRLLREIPVRYMMPATDIERLRQQAQEQAQRNVREQLERTAREQQEEIRRYTREGYPGSYVQITPRRVEWVNEVTPEDTPPPCNCMWCREARGEALTEIERRSIGSIVPTQEQLNRLADTRWSIVPREMPMFPGERAQRTRGTEPVKHMCQWCEKWGTDVVLAKDNKWSCPNCL